MKNHGHHNENDKSEVKQIVLTLSHPGALLWWVKSSGVRQSKIILLRKYSLSLISFTIKLSSVNANIIQNGWLSKETDDIWLVGKLNPPYLNSSCRRLCGKRLQTCTNSMQLLKECHNKLTNM